MRHAQDSPYFVDHSNCFLDVCTLSSFVQLQVCLFETRLLPFSENLSRTKMILGVYRSCYASCLALVQADRAADQLGRRLPEPKVRQAVDEPGPCALGRRASTRRVEGREVGERLKMLPKWGTNSFPPPIFAKMTLYQMRNPQTSPNISSTSPK